MRTFFYLAAVALAVAAIAPVAAFADDAAALFKSKCAMCHGADGSGDTPAGKSMKARDLRSAEVQKQSGEDLEKTINNGKGKMPAYKGKLKEAEIDALVKYIKTLKK
jgi:cytochrome c6